MLTFHSKKCTLRSKHRDLEHRVTHPEELADVGHLESATTVNGVHSSTFLPASQKRAQVRRMNPVEVMVERLEIQRWPKLTVTKTTTTGMKALS